MERWEPAPVPFHKFPAFDAPVEPGLPSGVPAPASSDHREPGQQLRLRLYRIVFVALGLGVFGVAELLCVLFGWGQPADYEDPFVGFSRIHPLFVLNEASGRYEIPKAKQKFFSPDSFPAEKERGAFRIFSFGGSTVKGRPYSKETSFTTWLELTLKAADPGHDWESINCGGISYASYRLVPMVEECLAYEPDLFVICTGHNEFLEDRTYERLKEMPEPLAVSHHAVSRLRTYTLFRAALLKATGRETKPPSSDRHVMAEDVEALLDYRGGLEVYDRNDQWTADVIRHYEHNLRAMISLARAAGVKVLLVKPPSNLRDSPPFKSQNKDGLSIDATLEWEQLITEAKSRFREDQAAAAELLEQALAIDGRHALTWYELGKCREALGQTAKARTAFLKARENDICPLRMLSPMEDALERVAKEAQVPLIDAHALLESESRMRILGSDQLVDHIHPSIEGHQKIADALLAEMVTQGWAKRGKDWSAKRDAAFKSHRASLDQNYFIEAQRALYGLNSWAAGRVDGPPIESREKAKVE